MFVFFLSLQIFRQRDISTTVSDRNFKFGIQVQNDKLHRGIKNGPSPICFSLCFFFLSLQIFRQRYLHTFKDRNFKFGIEVRNDKLHRGIANGHSSICTSVYLFFFLSLQIFWSKISPQPFKIETSN